MNTSVRIQLTCLVEIKAVAAVLSATAVGQTHQPVAGRNKPEQEEVPERSVPHDEPVRAAASALDTLFQDWNPLRACMAVVADAPQLELVLVEVHDESWMVEKFVVLSPQRFPLIPAYLVGVKAVAAVLSATVVGQVHKPEDVPASAVDHWSMAHDDPIRAALALDAI